MQKPKVIFEKLISKCFIVIYLDDLNTMIHLQPAIRFNGGGHINHAIFWQVLCPKEGGKQPDGALAEQIKKDFGSFDKMVYKVADGVGWVIINKINVYKLLLVQIKIHYKQQQVNKF
jgi:superoxide dismutase